MSSDVVIKAENIGKRYVIGHRRSKDDGLRHMVEKAVRAPFGWLRSRRGKEENESEEFWALKNVSFEVKQGEVVGIIGRNGAGKSTLLKILSRITEPTTGRIDLQGRVASLLEVGTGFHPELTGRENIFLNGAILGMSRLEIRKKFDEIVAFSEIEKFLDTPVKRYSSGMYVRLAFAVAAHLDPEILVIDEVLAVGDVQFQQKCLGKIQQVSSTLGRTVLFVSHQTETIDRLTNRCLWLANGSIFRSGDTKPIISEYLNFGRGATVSLPDYRVSNIPKSIAITQIYTCDAHRGKRKAFRQGELFNIVIEVESQIATRFDAAIVIENDREHALFTTHLSDTSSPATGLGPIRFSVPFDPPVLRKGHYKVSLAVYTPDLREFFDVIHHLPLFEVAGTADTSFPDDFRWGDLYFRVPWEAHTQ